MSEVRVTQPQLQLLQEGLGPSGTMDTREVSVEHQEEDLVEI